MRRVLNVGGGSRKIPIPVRYEGWEHVLLDVDDRYGADVILDARRLMELAAAGYDAVYCSNNLEHFYRHDAIKVLAGFLHVLKPEGFAEIRVPDMTVVMRYAVEAKLDIEDPLYHLQGVPIRVRDVIYGYGREIESSGQDFYAHKTGFTPKSLTALLGEVGFTAVITVPGSVEKKDFELLAFAFKTRPTEQRVNEVLNG